MSNDYCKTETRKRQVLIRSCSSNLRRLTMLTLMAVMIFGSLGCRCIETFHTAYVDGPIRCYRDRIWAERAYNARYGKCRRSFEAHFEKGFIEGYSAVCQGGDGFVPAMPPRDYWGSEYQTADGAKCVSTWFEGYPAGAAAARQEDAGTYHKISLSKMMESAITQDEETPIKQRSANAKPDEKNSSSATRETSNKNAQIPVMVDPSVNRTSKIIPAGWNAR